MLDMTRIDTATFSHLAIKALLKAKLGPCRTPSGDCNCGPDGCRRAVKWEELPTKASVAAALDDLDRVSGLLSAALADGAISGFDVLRKTQQLEEAERILKGALGFAANSRQGARGTACLKPKEHREGCRCRNMTRSQVMAVGL